MELEDCLKMSLSDNRAQYEFRTVAKKLKTQSTPRTQRAR